MYLLKVTKWPGEQVFKRVTKKQPIPPDCLVPDASIYCYLYSFLTAVNIEMVVS